MNITIFNEYHPNEQSGKAAKTYPGGIHTTLAELFGQLPDVQVRTATQEEPVHGLTDEVLDSTDVLVWWSKDWNNELLESVADKVASRILGGMGAIFLHSGKNSKPFRKLMGTTCATNPGIRAGVTFRRGAGKIFYFQPGHETFPVYRDEAIRRVLLNAARWAAPTQQAAPAVNFAKPKTSIKTKIFKFLK